MHECWPSGGSSQTVEQRECPATCLSSVHSHRRPERHTVCGACHRSAVPASTGTSIRECAWQQSTGPTASPRIRAPSTVRNPTSSPACTTSTCPSRGSGWEGELDPPGQFGLRERQRRHRYDGAALRPLPTGQWHYRCDRPMGSGLIRDGFNSAGRDNHRDLLCVRTH